MSYDVNIGKESFNYTYNVSKFFCDHFPETGRGGGLRELNDMTGAYGLAMLTETFRNIERTRIKLWKSDVVGEPDFCARYDAPNGWGSVLGAIMFLAQIMAACAANPDEKITIS